MVAFKVRRWEAWKEGKREKKIFWESKWCHARGAFLCCMDVGLLFHRNFLTKWEKRWGKKPKVSVRERFSSRGILSWESSLTSAFSVRQTRGLGSTHVYVYLLPRACNAAVFICLFSWDFNEKSSLTNFLATFLHHVPECISDQFDSEKKVEEKNIFFQVLHIACIYEIE